MPGPKTRSTKKNTAPKGVAPKLRNPTLDQPTTPFWNPSDFPSGNDIANYLNQQRSQWNYYSGNQGVPSVPTPMPEPSDMPAANVGAYPWMYNPASPTTPALPVTYPAATPMYDPYDTGNVNIGDPNFYLQTAPEGYAPSMTTGNVPAGGSYADWQEWNRQMKASDPYWNYYNPYNSQYAWQWDPDAPGTLMAGADPRSQEGFPWHEALNIPWSSSYAPEFYKNLAPKQYQWLSGSSNGGTMASAGWRRPGRYYIPDQRVTRAGPDGPVTAERPPRPSRRGDNDGNNQNLSIPAWVGPLVSWRT